MYTAQPYHGFYKNAKDLSDIRLTIDTAQDYAYIRDVYEHLYQGAHDFFLDDIMTYLQRRGGRRIKYSIVSKGTGAMNDLFDLTGKTAVVTGGSGHLGRAMCEGLAQYGASVVVASRNEDACRRLAEELSVQYHITAAGIGVDILDTDRVRHLFASVANRFGTIDVLVNNAFVSVQGFVAQLDDALWREGIDGTVGAVFRCIREVLPYMQRQKRGKIINIASMYGMIAPDPAMYDGNVRLNNPACYGAGKSSSYPANKIHCKLLRQRRYHRELYFPGCVSKHRDTEE